MGGSKLSALRVLSRGPFARWGRASADGMSTHLTQASSCGISTRAIVRVDLTCVEEDSEQERQDKQESKQITNTICLLHDNKARRVPAASCRW